MDQSDGRELLNIVDYYGTGNYTNEILNATDVVLDPQTVPHSTAAPLSSTTAAAIDSSDLTA